MTTSSDRIAIIVDTFDEYCQKEILNGVYSKGKELNYEMATFHITTLKHQDTIDTHYDFVTKMINKEHFAGVIVFSGALSEHTNEEYIKNYIHKLDLPVVSIASNNGTCASIEIDNKKGIIDLISHFVEVHNFNKIAFIGGPETNNEAILRLEAYKEGLNKHSIPIDDSIIVHGDFSEHSGVIGVRKLIGRGFDFDAIICADDVTAFGAIKELNNQDIAVPDFVAVAGFDDILEARMFSPTLTTVSQPFSKQGSQAVEKLHDYIDRHHFTGEVKLPTTPIIRESCGCINKELSSLNSNVGKLNKKKWLTSSGDEFITFINPIIELELNKFTHINGDVSNYKDYLYKSASLIWNYFYEMVVDSNESNTFIHTVNSMISQHIMYANNLNFIEEILNQLVIIVNNLSLKDKQVVSIQKILFETKIIVTKEKSKIELFEKENSSEQELFISESAQHILNSEGKENIIKTLISIISELEIESCAVVEFENIEKNKLSNSAILSAIVSNGKEREISLIKFDTKDIVPEDAKYFFTDGNYILTPLFFKGIYFGYLIFSITKKIPDNAYETLRFTTSVALYQDYIKNK